MRKNEKKSLQRTHLDKRLAKLRKESLAPPPNGWIRAVREAIGMSATQLAKRMGVTPQAIKAYETSEKNGTITLTTLDKIARQMGCEAHIVMLPKESLENIVQKQARKVATKLVRYADKHMQLESQGTGKRFLERQIMDVTQDIAEDLKRELWDE